MVQAATKTASKADLHARISELIRLMDIEFKDHDIGVEFDPDDAIRNLGPARMGIVWTDTGDDPNLVPVLLGSGNIADNWYPVKDFSARARSGKSWTNGWGFWVLKAPAEMRTTGRIAFPCQPIDLPRP